jgi:hypothetical protein
MCSIRQTNRVKGTWQIFDLNEKKKEENQIEDMNTATSDITSDC